MRETHRTFVVVAYFLAWILYFALFWSRLFFLNEQGDLVAGHINIWGDWAVHFTMGSSMGYHDLWPTSSPLLADATFSYPFLANWISALLIRVGMPFISAFVIPSFFFSVLIVCALFLFYKSIFKSLGLAMLASVIFLFNGGMGWYYFAQDVGASSEPLQTFFNPTHEYTRLDDEQIKWISVIDSMIIPQRAFTHGFPLALIALALIRSTLIDQRLTQRTWHSPKRLWRLVVPGLLLGILPLVHTHSFLASGIILSSWGGGEILDLFLTRARTRWRPVFLQWGVVASITSIVALPILTTFFFGQVNGFIQWYPGWLAREYEMNWLLFWFKNWGVVPLLACLGWYAYWRQHHSYRTPFRAFTTFAPFFLIFVLTNLWLFQPFAWDNTKLIVWAAVGMAGCSAVALKWLWYKAATLRTPAVWLNTGGLLFGRTLVIGIALFTLASGVIDAYWIQRIDLHHYTMYSKDELVLAAWARTNTSPHSRWLTGDQHNHWLYNLTGRQQLMAYRGWLWTHGYNYYSIERDVFAMFAGESGAAELLTQYGVDYIVVGPNEMRDFRANEIFFKEKYELAFERGATKIFAKK